MGKKYQEGKQKINAKKLYAVEEAITLLKEVSYENFDTSIELHCHLGIDPRQSAQQIRANVSLPYAFGKTKRVIAFVLPEYEEKAKQAGADIIGTKEVIEEIKTTGKINFDIAVAMPDAMKYLTTIAKVLGPRGLMPSPKNDTITSDMETTIQEIKRGKVSYKNDDTSNVHITIGKRSMENHQIQANLVAAVGSIQRHKPSGAKGIYMQSLTLSSTMGPAIKMEVPK